MIHPPLGPRLEGGGKPVDEGYLQEQAEGGQRQKARRRTRERGPRAIHRPVRAERQQHAPEEQHAQEGALGAVHQRVAHLDREQHHPHHEGHEARAIADEHAERRQHRDTEQQSLERRPPVEEVERERPGAQHLLQQIGAGHDARVGVVRGEVGGPDGEIGERQQRQHDTERRERAQIRAEDIHDLRVRPALYRCFFGVAITLGRLVSSNAVRVRKEGEGNSPPPRIAVVAALAVLA